VIYHAHSTHRPYLRGICDKPFPEKEGGRKQGKKNSVSPRAPSPRREVITRRGEKWGSLAHCIDKDGIGSHRGRLWWCGHACTHIGGQLRVVVVYDVIVIVARKWKKCVRGEVQESVPVLYDRYRYSTSSVDRERAGPQGGSLFRIISCTVR